MDPPLSRSLKRPDARSARRDPRRLRTRIAGRAIAE